MRSHPRAFPPPARGGEKPLLLLLDRSFDALTPLLHEYTYEAMAHDLLQVHGDRYRYNYVSKHRARSARTLATPHVQHAECRQSRTRMLLRARAHPPARQVSNANERRNTEVLLNETDPLWVKYRHAHIADLVQTLHDDYKAFLAQNKEAAALGELHKGGGGGGVGEMRALRAGIQGVQKFQEQTGRYSMHINIADELVRKYSHGALEPLSALEQCMACGEETSGKAYRTALADVRALLARRG